MESIFEVELEKELGYGYIIMRSINRNLVFFILDIHSADRLNDYSDLHLKSYLIAPSLGRMFPPKIKKYGWKKLYDNSISNMESISIYVKSSSGISIQKSKNWANLDWHTFDDFLISPDFILPYESVKHLPLWGHLHPDLIKYRLTLIWIRRLGKEILDFYPEETMSWSEKAVYYEMINTPFYDEIEVHDIFGPS